ncbi:hypothetical protein EON67_10960 [archaeon]|nr:MAG: hypothetical protein EON67_10960 [archaeon]
MTYAHPSEPEPAMLDAWSARYGYGVFDLPAASLPRAHTRTAACTEYVRSFFKYYRAEVVSVRADAARLLEVGAWESLELRWLSGEGAGADASAMEDEEAMAVSPWEVELLCAPHAEPAEAALPAGVAARTQPRVSAQGCFIWSELQKPWSALCAFTRFDVHPSLPRALGTTAIDCIRRLRHDDDAQPFLEAVDVEQYPTYVAHVPAPMDLHLILNRLLLGYYRTARALR